MSDINVLTDRLAGVQMRSPNQALAFCPSHDDKREQSLSVAVGDNGVLLLNCFAGCETRDVLDSIGMTFRDLYPTES